MAIGSWYIRGVDQSKKITRGSLFLSPASPVENVEGGALSDAEMMRTQVVALRFRGKSVSKIGRITGLKAEAVRKILTNYSGAISSKKRRKKVMQDLRNLRGSACEKCGYNKCQQVLHFHHSNPNDKVASISSVASNWSVKRLMEEVKKCQLLCANCHYEIEYETSKSSVAPSLREAVTRRPRQKRRQPVPLFLRRAISEI